MRYLFSIPIIIIALLVSCASPEPAIRLADNAEGTRAEILAAIPHGTSIEKATAVMRANGFRCEPRKNAAFLERTGIDYLYCDRERAVGLMVGRRWQVAFVDKGGWVMDILVGTGLIGP
ncbi:MAG: hypothetical protein KBA61_02450 [Spirochaetes bacterium]|nr:hypothetical protein [Spirochaetota bacterium]